MGKCKKCGKQRAEVYKKGLLCSKCKMIVSQNVVAQLRAKSGPYYDKWKAGMIRSFEQPPEKKPRRRRK